MRGGEAAARRYARALLDVALEKGDNALRQDLDDLGQLYADNAELRTMLLHPGVPAEKKTAVIAAVLRGRPSDLLQRLVTLLVQRDRIELLPLIVSPLHAIRGLLLLPACALNLGSVLNTVANVYRVVGVILSAGVAQPRC